MPPVRLILLLLLVCATTLVQAREVRVGLYENNPKLFSAPDGAPSGIFFDLLQAVAEGQDWQLTYVPCAWEQCLAELAAGRLDLMPDVAYTEARARDFEFHATPALLSWSQLYRRPGVQVVSYPDLAGKRLAVLQGSVQEQFLSELLQASALKATLLPAPSLQEAFAMTARGEADVAAANQQFGDRHQAAFGLQETTILFNPARLFFAAPKGRNGDLLQAIDGWLAAHREVPDGAYQRILRQWGRGETSTALPPVVWWSGAALSLLLLLVAGGNLWLRREVARQIASVKAGEARFREVFDNISDAIFVHDAESGRLLQVNQRLCEMYGCDEALALRSPISAFSSNEAPYDGAEAARRLALARQQGQQVYEWQARRLDDGRLFWVEVSLRYIAFGGEARILAVVRDISERKAHELELLRHREHLEEMIAQRTAELDKARREALHLAEVKSEFLANMSHEIRTPLNGVLGLAQIGQRRFVQPEVQQAFGRIVESGRLLQRVIDDILDFSKIEAGKLGIEAVEFSLDELLPRVLGLVRESAEAKGLSLHSGRGAALPARCLGDSLRIQQILLNLLSNAIKFTDTGQVSLQADLQGGQLVFSVSDSGIGISEAQQQRLFQPFTQADASITRRFGGTGLGLAISGRLVQLLGGSVTVHSQPGQGSEFVVRLPYVAPPPAQDVAPAALAVDRSAGQKPLAGLHLLVVDDSEINCLVLQELLTEDGALVQVAADGEAALAAVREAGPGAFDAVLMDVMMPGMDGHQATREIHALQPGLPVIGQTAYADESELQKCLDAGMVERLTKPLDPDQLVATVLRYARPVPATGNVPAAR